MKNTKRGLSLFFALVLMLTSVGIGLSTGTLKSEVPEVEAVSKADASPITFYVPETIYLTPHLTSATTFQYYVDSTTAGVLNTSNNKTTGQIYFNCAQASGNNVTISCSGATGITYDTGTVNATTFSRNITAGTLSTGLAQGAVSTLTWTASYTVGGKAMTAKAYTVCYAPQVQPVAAVARTKNTDGASAGLQALLSGWAYISGIHTSATGNRRANTTGNYVLNPMQGVISPVNGHINPGTWFTTDSTGWTNFQEKETGANQFIQQTSSPWATLNVDTSRYTNINQIPNLKHGYAITDMENMEKNFIRYASNFSNTVSGWRYGDFSSEEWGDINAIIRDIEYPVVIFGSNNTVQSARDEKIYYGEQTGGDMWSQSISAYDIIRLKWASWCENDGEWNAISCLVNVNLVKADKGALRAAVRAGVNGGLQAADYPADSGTQTAFVAYENEVKAAAERLGNPTNSDNISNNIAFRLSLVGPKTTYKANITHTATDGEFTYTDPELTFSSGDVVTAQANTTNIIPPAKIGRAHV